MPQFMRWVRGVVDCEDVPLNISRESLQDSDLIRRLGDIITKRMLKFLGERAKKEPEKYVKWYGKMGVFLKEGICGDQSYMYKDALTPLLRFETSSEAVKSEGDDKPRHAQISLDQYVERMPEGQKDIYYLVAPGGRKQPEISPYLEHLKRKGHELWRKERRRRPRAARGAHPSFSIAVALVFNVPFRSSEAELATWSSSLVTLKL